jgi:predicted RNase H-like HicB family nuclease
MTKYTIIIEKGKGNFSAYAPDLPGVVAAGETEEETVKLMEEAIELHIEGLKEDKLPIPQPTISARSLEVAV